MSCDPVGHTECLHTGFTFTVTGIPLFKLDLLDCMSVAPFFRPRSSGVEDCTSLCPDERVARLSTGAEAPVLEVVPVTLSGGWP